MRFLLAIPPLFYAKRWTQVQTAHLLNLFSWIRRSNPSVEVRVLDLDKELGSLERPQDLARFQRTIDAYLKAFEPDVVGLSCWTSLHYAGTIEMARRIKRWRQAVPVIVGGYHPTALPGDFRDPPGLFDYVVQGEGEVALSRILANGPDPQPEPIVIQGEPVPMEEEELLYESFPYHQPGKFEVFLSRGCPFPCQFCVEPLMVAMRGSTWRSYSWEKTEALLRRVIEQGRAKYLVFGDALFGGKKSFRHAVWRLLAEYPDPPAVWCETRVDLLDEVDYDALARLPVQLDVGLDAFTVEAVKRMQKSRQPERYLQSFDRFVNAMAERGSYVRAYLILNYPGETMETLRGTIAAIEDMVHGLKARHGRSNLFVGAQCYQLFPGTPDYSRRAFFESEYGARFPNDGWWRVAAPAPEVRAASYLPSRDLLAKGGLGASESAIEYIRTVCRKHGMPAVHHLYGDDEIPPQRFRGGSFEALLGGNAARLDGLRLTLAPHVAVEAAQAVEAATATDRGFIYDSLLSYSARIDAKTIATLEELRAAPSLAAGLAAVEARDGETLAEAVRSSVTGLLDQGFLELEFDHQSPRAVPRLNLLTTEGPARLEAADDDAAKLWGALIANGYLRELPVLAAWFGQLALFAAPPTAIPLAPCESAAPDGPGAFWGVGTGRQWPALALATGAAALPSNRRWRRIATGPVPTTFSIRSRILGAVPRRAWL